MTIFTTANLPKGFYDPPTGISRFSATYDDTNRVMRVQVRGFVEFLTPIGKAAWTPIRNTTFLDQFDDGIDQVWSQKFELARGGVRVRPIIEFVREPVLGNAHLKVTVQAGVAPPEMAAFITSRSKMNTFAAGLDIAANGDLILRLDEGTVLPYSELIPPPSAASMAQHDSQAAVFGDSNALAAASLKGDGGHVVFANGSAALNDSIRQQVAGAMAFMRTIVSSGMGRVPLNITGYRNRSEAANLSMDRAALVAAEVARVGKLKPALVSAVDGGSRHFGHRYAKIRTLDLPQIMAKVDYTAAIHEFGHCLGLPDEYRLYDGMSIAGAHTAFDQLCRDANLRPRPYPAKHDSIMSCGMRAYPSHYVTILDCLRRITGQRDWMIV